MVSKEVRVESNNQSILNVSERNDSKTDFLFKKGLAKEKKLDENLQYNNSFQSQFDSDKQQLKSLLNSVNIKSIESPVQGHDNQVDQIKQISQFQRLESSYSDYATVTQPQQNNKKKNSIFAVGKKVNQVHSLEKTNTPLTQQKNQQQEQSINILHLGKRNSNDMQRENLFTNINQFTKQKNKFFSLFGNNFLDKSETNSSINHRKSIFRWNIVSKFENVLAFINILKNNSTMQESYRSLNQKHYELIGDKSDINVDFKSVFPGRLKYLFDRTIHRIPIFSPESHGIIFWNFLNCICILVQFIAIPLKISFFIDFDDFLSQFFLFYIHAFIFISEILIRFNLSFYQEGILVQSRFKIIQNYMFQSYFFWLDLITTVIFLGSKESNSPFLIIIVVLRIFQLFQLVNDIDEHYQLTQRFSSLWNLIKLLLIIMIVAHFTGCGFHYVAYLQSEDGIITWLDKQKIFNEEWPIRYLNSLYWASITMVTVGYGDIVPVTSVEKIYVITMTLISAGVFAYSIDTIGGIFGEIQKKKLVMKTQKRHISNYMRSRGINGQLQIEVLKYLENVKQEEIEIANKGQEIIHILSEQIQEKLQSDYYGRILQESKTFQGYSLQFLQEVSQIMKEQLYGPGEVLFSLGQHDDRMLFIIKGNVQLFIPIQKNKQIIELQKLEKGEVGHYGFFTQQQRSTSLRSLGVSIIAYIPREDFIQILQKFPSDHEKFCQTKDILIFQQQKNKIKCFACQVNGHSIMNCQKVHYKRDRQTLIWKYNYNYEQQRNEYDRKLIIKKNTFSLKKQVRQNLLKLRGEKMSNIYQIEFLQDDFDWLEKNKDQTIFQVIPKLYYQNGEYGINSETDFSYSSEDFNSINSDQQLSDESFLDSSIPNSPSHGFWNNQKKRANIDEDIQILDDKVLNSQRDQVNSKNTQSPLISYSKKENQFTQIMNQFSKKRTIKQKQSNKAQNNEGNRQRRKSEFCGGGNGIVFKQLNFANTEKQNQEKSTVKQVVSEKSIDLKQNSQDIINQQDKQASQQEQQPSQGNVVKEVSEIIDESSFQINKSDLQQYEIGQETNKIFQEANKELKILLLEKPFSLELSKQIQNQQLDNKSKQISPEKEGNQMTTSDMNQRNNSEIQSKQKSRTNLYNQNKDVSQLPNEKIDEITNSEQYEKSQSCGDQINSNQQQQLLETSSPIFKLESQKMGQQTSQNPQKYLISFQNLNQSSELISEDKTNSSQTRKSKDVTLHSRNFNLESSKTSNFVARTGNFLEFSENQNTVIENNQKGSFQTSQKKELSPILKKDIINEQKDNQSFNIPFIQSINEIENEEKESPGGFQLNNKNLQESGRDNNEQNDQADQKNLNEQLDAQHKEIQPKPQLHIQFNPEQPPLKNSNQQTLSNFSQEARLKMLKQNNSSMRDIFQKKQETQKSKFANLHNQVNNQIEQSPKISLLSGKRFQKRSSVQNNLNTSITQAVSNQAPQLPSPSYKPLTIKQVQAQLNQSNISISSPMNREKKEQNTTTNGQLIQQIQQVIFSQLNSISQQIQGNQQKQPSTSQTIQNYDLKSPKNNQMSKEIDQHKSIENFTIIETDSLKQYTIYFPYNNFSNVIKQFNYSRAKRQIEFQRKAKRKLTKDSKKTIVMTPNTSRFNQKKTFQQSGFGFHKQKNI